MQKSILASAGAVFQRVKKSPNETNGGIIETKSGIIETKSGIIETQKNVL